MIELRTYLIILIFSATSVGFCQQEIDEAEPIPDPVLFATERDSLVNYVFSHPEIYHCQFMLTDIVKYDSTYTLGNTYDYSNPAWYFYPASMVKMPIALLSLEKLKQTGYSTQAKIKFDRDFECGNMKFVDESRQKPKSIGEMLRELIIVSNNTYYNSFYHFLNPKHINDELNAKGLRNTSIYRDFSGCEMPLNLKTHGFQLEQANTDIILAEKMNRLELDEFASKYTYDPNKLFGSKHEYRGEIVDGPFDFNYNLEYPIRDMHVTSLRLFFPEFFNPSQQWDIRKKDRELLIESMKSVPKDLGGKKFSDKKKYPDNLYKYIVKGDENAEYDSIISYSKMGISYGFVTESAYIIDPRTDRRYILTVNIYVNSNDTVNDGKYEYDELARPFLARFGQLLLEF